MGELRVPAQAHWGASTQRALENFTISGSRVDHRIIRALGLIKRAAARTNRDLGLLEGSLEHAIIQASTELVTGKLDDQFPIDAYQTGSGTSTNMNANEVLASRANEILGRPRGSREPVHPNDHVNMGQSSNDVIPTAIHVAAATLLQEDLLPALKRLARALEEKGHRFDGIVKIGRTHLQDATPIRLGQEFSGWAQQARNGALRAELARDGLLELPLGGTAVGTGVNTHPDFARKAIGRLAEDSGLAFRVATNAFEAQAARDGIVDASGRLNTIACSLMKIVNDLRWLASGPRGGLFELRLPALQPGSSIMPGKVNPVIPEAVAMACARVMGNHVTITVAVQSGNFELNVMMPVMAEALLESTTLLAASCESRRKRCVEGIEANEARCAELVTRSLAMATALVPAVGYDAAAAVAKTAWDEDRTVREVTEASAIIPAADVARVLDPMRMTEPGLPGAPPRR
jgi:fumarate hydratase class II